MGFHLMKGGLVSNFQLPFWAKKSKSTKAIRKWFEKLIFTATFTLLLLFECLL